MSEKTDILNSTVINGVEVTEYEDGHTVFVPTVDTEKLFPQKENVFKRFWNWITNKNVTPYVKLRDLSDPFGDRRNDPSDDGSGSKNAVEIGVKVSF